MTFIRKNRRVCQSIILMCFALTSCKKDLKQEDQSFTGKAKPESVMSASLFSSGPAIVSAHRVNDLIKVDEVKNAGITSLEVDIFVGLKNGQPTCLVGHEAGTATGQTLEQYFANLYQKIPNFTHVWLDCKDLNSTANEQLFMTTLNNLNNLYSIKSRVLVESQYIPYLVSFKQQGWTVSYYCNWGDVYGQPAAQQQIVMDGMYNQLTTYGIDGISYDAAVDSPMKNYFSTKTVNGQPVKMYAWALSRYYGETDLQTKLAQYSHLGVLLISFYSQEATLTNGANYKLVSALTNEPSKLVDVNSSTPSNSTPVTLWTYNYPTTNNQVWKLRAVGGGYYALKTLADTTKALDVSGGSSTNGTPTIVYAFNNSNNQRWKITYVGNGYYNLSPAHATNKNLDVSGGNTANGTKIQIWNSQTGNSQKFKLIKQ